MWFAIGVAVGVILGAVGGIAMLYWLLGTDAEGKPIHRAAKRGKWATSPEGGWQYMRDPRDNAEPNQSVS